MGLLATLSDTRPAHAMSTPPWLQAQVSAPVPDHDEKATAVLLYSEALLTVQPNGRLKRLERKVYRILRPDGSRYGFVRVDVDSQTHVSVMHGWSIPAEGKGYEVGEKDVVETSLSGVENGELMSDVRTRLLRIPAANPGAVIGYELEQEEKPYILTDEWIFEDTVPVRESRYTVQLPPGWSYRTTWINHPDESPSTPATGQSQWLLRDMKAISLEERMPPWEGIAGQLFVSFQPPGGQAAGFQSWQEMGTWYGGLIRDRGEASAQIKQKVTELTQSATTPLDKMKALAAFVQSDVRYVAIELGIGGFQPHSASDVFTNRYGDCKDKANLLKSMLTQIGIEADYFIINTERGAITATTPPHLGFDHMILGIRLPASLQDPSLLAVVPDAKGERILFFDPTDPYTPIGKLRGVLQSSYGVLFTSNGGELLRTPQLSDTLNSIDRTARMTLDESGTLHGDIHEKWSGDRAAQQRAMARSFTKDTDRIKPVESVAAESFSAFDIQKATVTNNHANDRPYEWDYTLDAPRYAKVAGDLLIVRPRVLGSKSSGLLETKEPRRHPIEFTGGERDTDVFEITLPAGYEVDELPPPVNEDFGFVAYQSKTEKVGNAIRYSRTFEVKDLSIPVSKAAQLQKLYRIIADDERNSAVLKPTGSH
jgi:hypothetical protein